MQINMKQMTESWGNIFTEYNCVRTQLDMCCMAEVEDMKLLKWLSVADRFAKRYLDNQLGRWG